jgi:hypothetical protein
MSLVLSSLSFFSSSSSTTTYLSRSTWKPRTRSFRSTTPSSGSFHICLTRLRVCLWRRLKCTWSPAPTALNNRTGQVTSDSLRCPSHVGRAAMRVFSPVVRVGCRESNGAPEQPVSAALLSRAPEASSRLSCISARRRHARGLVEGAHPADRPRRPLDAQARQGQAARGRRGAPGPAEIAVPMFGYKNHLGIDRATASSAASRSPTPRAMTAPSSAPCSTQATPPAASGPTPPTAARPTSRCWTGAACGPSSSAPSRAGGRCPPHRPRQRHPRGCAACVEHVFAAEKRRMGLVVRTVGLARATARSRSPTSPTTCAAWPGSRGELCPLDPSRRQRDPWGAKTARAAARERTLRLR